MNSPRKEVFLEKHKPISMEYFILAVKVAIFLSIINVWFIRFNSKTPYRPGEAGSMREEFEKYGLPAPMMYLVGALKVLAATGILASVWYPEALLPSAGVMGILMLGAIGMHLKVKDPLIKAMPAGVFFLLSAFLVLHTQGYF
jgi:hypothetical protein